RVARQSRRRLPRRDDLLQCGGDLLGGESRTRGLLGGGDFRGFRCCGVRHAHGSFWSRCSDGRPAQRGTRGRFSPAVATSSRMISLTPPPKVTTRFCLVRRSSQRSSSAVSGSAGSPKRPTISSASLPASC